jgi:uncharacterized protein GlcG (DUF336 family)
MSLATCAALGVAGQAWAQQPAAPLVEGGAPLMAGSKVIGAIGNTRK